MLYKKIWIVFCFFLLVFFIKTVFKNKYQVYYESKIKNVDIYPTLVVCFHKEVFEKKCEKVKEKIDFKCEMNFQFDCRLKNITLNQLLENLKKCNFSKKILFYQDKEFKPNYFLSRNSLCISYKYKKRLVIKKKYFVFNFHKNLVLDFEVFFQFKKSHFLEIPFYHRKCYKLSSNESRVLCRQANIFFRINDLIRLKKPFETKCVDYGSDKYFEKYNSQFDCINKCFREKFIINKYLNVEYMKSCILETCNQKDCFTNSLIINELYKNQNNNYNKIKIGSKLLLSEAHKLRLNEK